MTHALRGYTAVVSKAQVRNENVCIGSHFGQRWPAKEQNNYSKYAVQKNSFWVTTGLGNVPPGEAGQAGSFIVGPMCLLTPGLTPFSPNDIPRRLTATYYGGFPNSPID